MSVVRSLPTSLTRKPLCSLRICEASSFSRSRRGFIPFGHCKTIVSKARTISEPFEAQQRKAFAPIVILLVFGAGYGFYSYTSKKTLLCEAPQPLERLTTKEIDGYPKNLIYRTMESINKAFALSEDSFQGTPHSGLVRYDQTSLPANEPFEDKSSSVALGKGRNADAYSGPQTAILIDEFLPLYVLDFIGLSGSVTDDRRVLQASSSEHINQSIRDAFIRLDSDIMKMATNAITGPHSLYKSMVDMGPANSGSCALFAFYQTAAQLLRVACVGDSRAVLGRRRAEGGWSTKPLSKDHTGYNEDEVARLKAEHPGEPNMIRDGRLLGLAVTRAFGDLRWKLSAHLQSLAQERFFGRSPQPSLLTPPYLNAEPVITTTKLDIENNDFLILTSKGLWDHLSSEQAVDLVGCWLEKNDVRQAPEEELTLSLDDDLSGGLGDEAYTSNPPDCPLVGRKYTNARYTDEKNWVVVDTNAATHLVRNALGGADEDLVTGLVGLTGTPFTRRMRDDITVKVIFFGNVKGEPQKATTGEDDSSPESINTIEYL
ncbi:MAG: hypothetical protein Q9218_002793 [Villophora microphyllina]